MNVTVDQLIGKNFFCFSTSERFRPVLHALHDVFHPFGRLLQMRFKGAVELFFDRVELIQKQEVMGLIPVNRSNQRLPRVARGPQ